ncbi:HAD-IA family hydrolase [Xylophilus sp. Kf1]|nr:HAD-IA family hydrolase [Xylophilus sp. Kf1]
MKTGRTGMRETSAIKAFLVDLDGTLVDTAEDSFRAYSRALGECGVSAGGGTVGRDAGGRNWLPFLPALLGRAHCAATAVQLARRKTERQRETPGNPARFNDALVVLLRQVRASGMRLALVTSVSAANVASVLSARPDVAGLFSLLVTGDDVDHHKPDPEAYRLAACRLGLQPHECLVIEDSDIGLAAGRAFGAAVLRVSMDGARR